MRQAEQPLPFVIAEGDQLNLNTEVLDDDDLTRVLLDQSRDAPCNASKKKDILLTIHDKKEAILREYEELDKLSLGVDLATRFTSILSYFLGVKNNIKKGKNLELASCIVTLYRIDTVYQDNVHHLEKRSNRRDMMTAFFWFPFCNEKGVG